MSGDRRSAGPDGSQHRDSGRPGGPDRDPEPDGRLRTTSAGAVIGFALVGLVLGWLVRPVSLHVGDTAPTVSVLPAVALLFVALVVGSLAWSTHRALHRRRERMQPHHAVNRLVLAKASALAGALVAGGYLGYALSWLGLTDAQLARERVLHAVIAGVAGMLLVLNALLLERACRVSSDDS